MRDKILAEHGTVAFDLKPSALVQAAGHDLAQRDRKGNAKTRRYLFAWPHVRDASGPFDLIRRALDEPSAGTGSAELNTRQVYRSPDLLRAALALSEGARW